jgi:hypothetical protein
MMMLSVKVALLWGTPPCYIEYRVGIFRVVIVDMVVRQCRSGVESWLELTSGQMRLLELGALPP